VAATRSGRLNVSPRPGELARLEATVRGRVQGVGYRFFVVSEAMDLGLTGWCANRQDGSVRVVAEGPRTDLERFLRILEGGPIMADVAYVDTVWMSYTGRFVSFGIESWGHRGD
jgi:acylphosphatase